MLLSVKSSYTFLLDVHIENLSFIAVINYLNSIGSCQYRKAVFCLAEGCLNVLARSSLADTSTLSPAILDDHHALIRVELFIRLA